MTLKKLYTSTLNNTIYKLIKYNITLSRSLGVDWELSLLRCINIYGFFKRPGNARDNMSLGAILAKSNEKKLAHVRRNRNWVLYLSHWPRVLTRYTRRETKSSLSRERGARKASQDCVLLASFSLYTSWQKRVVEGKRGSRKTGKGGT